MSTSHTVIAALKFNGGVIIAADSQASDLIAQVRWPCEKLDCIKTHPCVLGFSGSIGRAQRARENIEAVRFHPNMFERRERIRDALDRCLHPIYEEIRQESIQKAQFVLQMGLWGLAAYWAGNDGHILEFPLNGDSEFHSYFQAIGSGANTAHAIYRTLGGEALCKLDERKALPAMLRILGTCIKVEQQGVSEPLSVWIVAGARARKLFEDELDAHLEFVGRWLEKEQRVLFGEG